MSNDVPFARLEPRTRRRLVAGAVVRIALTTSSLLAAYYLMPLDDSGDGRTLMYFLLGVAIFVSTLTWQLRSIMTATYPGLRAVESIGVALPLLVIVFAVVYLSMAYADAESFSVPLSRSASLYFTITVLATVGFGDIVPKTDTARLVVSLQMLIDLVLIGVTAKLILGAARTGLERQRNEPKD